MQSNPLAFTQCRNTGFPYRVALNYGANNLLKVVCEVSAYSAFDAAEIVLRKIKPDATVFPGRLERPRRWSYANTLSGQRVYVEEI